MANNLVEVENLVKHYPVLSGGVFRKRQIGQVHAADDLSFSIKRAETLGLVGESGCGKTTTALAILGLEHPTSGRIVFDGQDIQQILASKDSEKILALRRKMQIVFQNPYGSLDPMMTVADIVTEPMAIHGHVPKEKREEELYRLLKMVGLEEYHAERYPHEFSGGQRQRICIARALATQPDFLVADEPVSSLDVSIRAQILNLLGDLQQELDLSCLYISHDLSSVRQITHRVAVMYLGRIVELAVTEELFNNTLHPYTKALIAAVPAPDPKRKVDKILLPGEVPSPINPPSGCRFHPRCKYAKPYCREEVPQLEGISNNHWVACHRYGEMGFEPDVVKT